MQNKKNSKLASAIDSIKRVTKKIKEVSDGYKIMNQKRQ
jgi:hypothetical protein